MIFFLRGRYATSSSTDNPWGNSIMEKFSRQVVQKYLKYQKTLYIQKSRQTEKIFEIDMTPKELIVLTYFNDKKMNILIEKETRDMNR